MTDAYEKLKETHPIYKKMKPLWDYYSNSYKGGSAYQNGKYLTPYVDEYGQTIILNADTLNTINTNVTNNTYAKRIETTQIYNLCSNVVETYKSFLFQIAPTRELANLADNEFVKSFMGDVDMKGQGIDSFFKTATEKAMVYGNIWIGIDKSSFSANTEAEAIHNNLRAYAITYIPTNVLDWKYNKHVSGRYELAYFKVIEGPETIVEWFPNQIIRTHVDHDKSTITEIETFNNPLGKIPFINMMFKEDECAMGIGVSTIDNIAVIQRGVYNTLSEIEQTARITNHPTLIVAPADKVISGAGSMVIASDELGKGERKLLQPSGANMDAAREFIKESIKQADREASLSSIRGEKTMSGIAIKAERQELNSKLSDFSDTVKETEMKVWKLFFEWHSIQQPDEFSIDYSKTFDTRDKNADLDLFIKAKSNVNSPLFRKTMDKEMAMIMIDDPETLEDVLQDIEKSEEMINTLDIPSQ